MSILFNKRLQTSQEVSPPILSFTSTLSDVAVDYAGSVTLDSTAVAKNPSTNTNGPGTITYQWYKNGVAISGQTSAILTLTNQTVANDVYYCVATYTPTTTSAPAINSPITSNTAKITLKNYLIFTKQPSSSSVTTNKSSTFGCAAVVGGFKSMSGFNPDLYGDANAFGNLDYNAAISQGFNDEDIRYYLENVFTGVIGAAMISRLNDVNFGNARNKNLKYEWYVDGVLKQTTFGPVCAEAPGFNGQGIYLDLTDYTGRVLVQFSVTQDSGIVHRIRIPDLGTVNSGVNAKFLTDGYISETLPGTTTPWGTHYLLLDGGRIYGPITSDTATQQSASGFLAVASEINAGSNQTVGINDGGGGQIDDMKITINKGFFRTYVSTTDPAPYTRTVGGVTFRVRTPPRVKYFSTYTETSSIVRSSSVFCKVVQINTSGALAGPPQDSNIVSWNVSTPTCLSWDDTRKPGARTTVLTNSGLKPGTGQIWYGPWTFGTSNDTCYVYFDIEIRDIYPRAVNSTTDAPFIAVFELRVKSNGSDIYNLFKVLEWNGNSRFENENNKQTLYLSSSNFNGQRVAPTGDNGIILFDRTNSYSPSNRLAWSGGQPTIDILLLATKRKSDGQELGGAFLTVNNSSSNNVLENGRRFDQFEEPY